MTTMRKMSAIKIRVWGGYEEWYGQKDSRVHLKAQVFLHTHLLKITQGRVGLGEVVLIKARESLDVQRKPIKSFS